MRNIVEDAAVCSVVRSRELDNGVSKTEHVIRPERKCNPCVEVCPRYGAHTEKLVS